jgi:hypothetical protein
VLPNPDNSCATDTPLLDQRLPELHHQALLHYRQGATDLRATAREAGVGTTTLYRLEAAGAPLGRAVQRSGVIVTIPILSGLHHHYVRI